MKSGPSCDLTPFFEPGSVAVIGSLRDPGGLGHITIRNLLQFGFRGEIYPVNPSCDEVLGLRAYAGVAEMPGRVDLSIIITPPATVPGLAERCARNGCRAALVMSENFAEAGGKGAQLQRELVEIGRRTGLRIMGPNTIGLMNTANRFVAIPYLIAYDRVRRGSIAWCSQTGFVSPAAQPLEDRSYPVSKMCDVGNKCDIDEVDLLNYLADDPETRVVAMHLEDVRDGRRFMEAARSLAARKPLLLLKPGRTQAGAKASASHTGSLAGDEQVYDIALRQAGAIRVYTWHEFWEMPRVLATQPLPRGGRLAMITLTGGAGVVAVDAAVEAGLTIASLSPAARARLSRISPRLARNPIDLGPMLTVVDDPYTLQEEATLAVLDDPNVDCASIGVWVGFADLIPAIEAMFERLLPGISKPVAVWIYGMQLPVIEEMSRRLAARGLPTFLDPETAVKSLAVAARYANIRRDLAGDAA